MKGHWSEGSLVRNPKPKSNPKLTGLSKKVSYQSLTGFQNFFHCQCSVEILANWPHLKCISVQPYEVLVFKKLNWRQYFAKQCSKSFEVWWWYLSLYCKFSEPVKSFWNLVSVLFHAVMTKTYFFGHSFRLVRVNRLDWIRLEKIYHCMSRDAQNV